MNKRNLVNCVAKSTGFTQSDVAFIINETISVIERALENDEPVSIYGFGTFKTKVRAEKVAMDIPKRKQIVVPERKVIVFERGEHLKKVCR